MKQITDISQLDFNKLYTHADYLTWQFKERVELLMGRIFKMSPAPGSQHQYVSSVLTAEIFNFLKGKKCNVFAAPFDVTLPITNKNGESNTVVQPDICVICDERKITDRGCNGAPDLIVEIISRSSVKKDLHEKFEIYEQSKVPEYWIVQPIDKSLSIFRLSEEGRYMTSKPLTYGDIAESKVIPGLQVDLDAIFRDVIYEPEEDYSSENIERL